MIDLPADFSLSSLVLIQQQFMALREVLRPEDASMLLTSQRLELCSHRVIELLGALEASGLLAVVTQALREAVLELAADQAGA